MVWDIGSIENLRYRVEGKGIKLRYKILGSGSRIWSVQFRASDLGVLVKGFSSWVLFWV
jgi:hypothetical protein